MAVVPPVTSLYKDPLTLAHGDHFSLQLISTQFDGMNYLKWSRTMSMALISKNKLDFVNGTFKRPTITDATYNDWERTGYTFLCWLLRSLHPSISDGLLYVTSSRQLWTKLEEMYNQSNAPHLYQLRKYMMQRTQGESTIAKYYAQLRSVWEDLLSLVPIPDCS
ncbi:hypothetical protein RND81_09G031200 [Saponaria officinalis]|uniref:Retrotransposon Copia-like N-terminal domain-containing protein n=1 Tax=Saponaria officinalis TaxID=3572 RepID=A0AAW1II44_SAPOF